MGSPPREGRAETFGTAAAGFLQTGGLSCQPNITVKAPQSPLDRQEMTLNLSVKFDTHGTYYTLISCALHSRRTDHTIVSRLSLA